ncbi:hypothetical protein RBJ75_17200 [Rhodopseudomonas sp. BAL398]|uniref:hypothetical protein n=1 Tax=Rhodopseudomonas sp. BAL398 TaxID=3034676 RepID=UPI00294B75FE|nr:hypothetical protein [Rhodopseudomonas sp. BAL398]WOK15902.1 hypothetical protein RBJ75_17200 [Rhodopseudomonas sp. BAL398]
MIVAMWLGSSVAYAGTNHEISQFRPGAKTSIEDGAATRNYAFGLDRGKAWYNNAGKWACIARSNHGTHAATTVWSAYTSSRPSAEKSALAKCNVSAANKQACRVSRCWVEGE